MSPILLRAAAAAAIAAIAMTSEAQAQMSPADHPCAAACAAMSPGAMPGQGQGQGAQAPQSGMAMQPGTMSRRMMRRMGPHRMMGGMAMMNMRGHPMKILFAIADADGDGALSFEEVTEVHKRIFAKVDANKDGKVTPEEIEAFWQN
jgi:hypothetical protein